MAEEEQVTAPVNADAAPAVEGETPKTEQSDATQSAEPEKDEKPELTPEQKKIASLEYKNRQIRRELNKVTRQLESKPKPSGELGKPPQISDFETLDEYVREAVAYNLKAEREVQKATKQAEAEKNQVSQEAQEAFNELMDSGLDKYEDFEDKVLNARITVPMRDAVFELDDVDVQAEIMYHLAKHPKEANRIAKLSALRQAAEIGKLEGKLSSKPAPKRPSSAPPPINPVGGNKTASDEIRDGMPFEDYLKVRNKQLGR